LRIGPGRRRSVIKRTPILRLIERPVGAGKSAFAKKLALQGDDIHVPLDEWFSMLFLPEKPATCGNHGQ
jgi:hypothetical protein